MTTAMAAELTARGEAMFAGACPALADLWAPSFERQARFADIESFADNSGFIWLRRLCKNLALDPSWMLYLTQWEGVASGLDEDSREVLRSKFEKAVPAKALEYKQSYNDAFLDVVSEMLAYAWMKSRCAEVKFLPEGRSRSPDLIGDGRVVTEVKHLRQSDFDRDYFARHQGEARPVNGYTVDLLIAKAQRVIDEGVVPKFQSYPAGGFDRWLFADFSFDTQIWGPMEGNAPGTKHWIVGEVREYLSKYGGQLDAIEFNDLGQLDDGGNA